MERDRHEGQETEHQMDLAQILRYHLGGPHFPLTSDAMKKVLTGHASREVLLSIVHVVVAGMACCSTLYLGHTLHNIFAVLQTPGSQIQSCSFKSEEARPSPHGNCIETICFIIPIYCNNAICASNITLLVHKTLLE
ncbi:hypothetical protein AAG906_000329 [Vitis piasezkii]